MTDAVRRYEPPPGGTLSRRTRSTLLRVHAGFAEKMGPELTIRWGVGVVLEIRTVDVVGAGRWSVGDSPRLVEDVAIAPGNVRGFLAMDVALAQALVDAAFGGPGTSCPGSDGLTPVERRVAGGFLAAVLSRLNGAWETYGECAFTLQEAGESRRPPADESFLIVAFRLRVGQTEGALEVGFPVAFVKSLIGHLEKGSDGAPSLIDDPKMHPVLRKKMEGVTVAVRACLAEPEVSLREMAGLEPGDVLNVGRAGSDVLLRAGAVALFKGQPGVWNGRLAVRISGLMTGDTRRNT